MTVNEARRDSAFPPDETQIGVRVASVAFEQGTTHQGHASVTQWRVIVRKQGEQTLIVGPITSARVVNALRERFVGDGCIVTTQRVRWETIAHTRAVAAAALHSIDA